MQEGAATGLCRQCWAYRRGRVSSLPLAAWGLARLFVLAGAWFGARADGLLALLVLVGRSKR